MKKSNQYLSKQIVKKDLLNGFSLFTLMVICLYGILHFIIVLNPQHAPDGNGFVSGLAQHLTYYPYFKFSFSAELIRLLSVLAGAAVGIFQFSFLHRKNYCQGLLSRGIKRGNIFNNRTLIPLIVISIITLIPQLIALGLNIDAFGVSSKLIICFLSEALYAYSSILVGFTVAVTACIFSGRIIEAVAGAASILMLPVSLVLFTVTTLESFLYGFDFNNSSPVWDLIFGVDALGVSYFFISPQEYAVNPDSPISALTKISLFSAVIWLVLCIIVLTILKKYFEKRFKPENVGFKGINKLMVFVSSLSLPLLLSTIIATLIPATSFAFPSAYALVFSTVIGVGAGVLCALACNVIFTFTVKKLQIGALSGGVQILLAIICVVISATGAFGNYYKTPDAEDIKAVKINAPFKYYFLNESYAAFLSANPYPSNLCLELTTEKDINTALEMQKAVSENGKGDVAATLKITYLLNNGNEIERNFEYVTEESLSTLLKLWETDSAKQFYKNMLFPETLPEKEYNWFECSQAPKITSQQQFTLTSFDGTGDIAFPLEDELNELKNAVYKDISEASAEDWFYPGAQMLGTLSFDVESSYYYGGQGPEFTIYLTEDMVNTISCLKKYGYYESLRQKRRPVQAVVYDIGDLIDYSFPDSKWETKATSPYFVSTSVSNELYYEFNTIENEQAEKPSIATEITNAAEIEALISTGYMAYNCHNKGKIVFVKYTADSYGAFVLPEGDIYE